LLCSLLAAENMKMLKLLLLIQLLLLQLKSQLLLLQIQLLLLLQIQLLLLLLLLKLTLKALTNHLVNEKKNPGFAGIFFCLNQSSFIFFVFQLKRMAELVFLGLQIKSVVSVR
jgi:hypothetical protein